MTNKERYLNLLRTVNRDGIEDLIEWLESSDFFTAPASTKYHNSRVGGLLEHSLNVYNALSNSEAKYICDIDSIIIVSLLHDICKANFYTVSYRNVKHDDCKWYKEPYYSVNDEEPLGHGEKSVILAMKYISLTDEEISAIRWHMGGFEPKENYNGVSGAFSKYPLTLLLHIADLKATYLLEREDN